MLRLILDRAGLPRKEAKESRGLAPNTLNEEAVTFWKGGYKYRMVYGRAKESVLLKVLYPSLPRQVLAPPAGRRGNSRGGSFLPPIHKEAGVPERLRQTFGSEPLPSSYFRP